MFHDITTEEPQIISTSIQYLWIGLEQTGSHLETIRSYLNSQTCTLIYINLIYDIQGWLVPHILQEELIVNYQMDVILVSQSEWSSAVMALSKALNQRVLRGCQVRAPSSLICLEQDCVKQILLVVPFSRFRTVQQNNQLSTDGSRSLDTNQED